MSTYNPTQAVLAIFADEMGLAFTVARERGTENEFDAANYVEGAARDIQEDGGRTAAALIKP